MPKYNSRRNDLAMIHIAKKQVGLDDDEYRLLLENVTGKTSAGDMTITERCQVLAEFKKLGFKTTRKFPPNTNAKTKGNEYERATSRLMISIWNRLHKSGKVNCGSVNCFHAWVANQVRPKHADLPKTKNPDTLSAYYTNLLINKMREWEARDD